MFSGNLSRTALTSLLRLLSVKKRHGILEVHAQSGVLRVFLADGLIRGVTISEGGEVERIIERLHGAELLRDDLAAKIRNVCKTLETTYDLLVGKNVVTKENFLSAKQAVELDLLHSLRLMSGAKYAFTPQVTQYPEHLQSAFCPAQILLDIIELEKDENLFSDLIGTDLSVVLRRSTTSVSGKFTPSEAAVWAVLETRRSLLDLFDCLLLSSFEIKRALLYLVGHKAIRITTSDGYIAELEEERLAEELKRAQLENITDENLFTEAAALLQSADGQVAPESAHGPLPKTPETPVAEQPKQSLSERLLVWNYAILEPAAQQSVALFVMIAFLFVIALISPFQLNRFIEAVAKLSQFGL